MSNKEQEIGVQTIGMSLNLTVAVFLENDKTAVNLVDSFGVHLLDNLGFEGDDPTHLILSLGQHLARLFGG